MYKYSDTNISFTASPLLKLIVISICLVFCAQLTQFNQDELCARYQFIDDGFYYLKIAHNIATRGFSSFDGIHETNGYQPLWALLLSIISVISIPNHFIFWITIFSSVIFFTLAALTFGNINNCKTNQKINSNAAISSVLFATNPLLFLSIVNGLETSLAICSLILFFFYLFKVISENEQRRRDIFILYVISLLTFLSRLDYAIIMLFCCGVILLYNYSSKRFFRSDIFYLMVFIIVVVFVYCSLNYIIFNLFLPISGIVKKDHTFYSLFSRNNWNEPINAVSIVFWPEKLESFYFRKSNLFFFFLGMLFSLLSATILLLSKKIKNKIFDLIIITQGWVHALSYLTIQGGGRTYYFIPLSLSIIWSIGIIGSVIINSSKLIYPKSKLAFKGLSLLLILAISIVYFNPILQYNWPLSLWRYERIRAAKWINSIELNKDIRIGSWWAGAFSFYCNRPVINLDGLVNNKEFLYYLQNEKIDEYLIKEKIKIIADYFPCAPQDFNSDYSSEMFDNRDWKNLEKNLTKKGHKVSLLKFFPDPQKQRISKAGFYIFEII